MSLSAEPSQSLNVADVIRGIWRRKIMLATLTLIGLGLGSATVFLSKPTYQTEAQIIIENSATSFERANSDLQSIAAAPVDERFITSQVSVIKSGDLLGRVADQLALKDNPEFNASLTKISFVKSILIATGFAEDPNLFTGRENALKAISSKLSVGAIVDSNIVTITARMNDKKAAADVTNAVAEAYVASTRENDAGATERARQWLGGQITDLRQKVSDSENIVEKYRTEAGLLKGQTATLGTQQISELNSQIGVAENAAGEATARAAEIKSLLASGGIEASSDVLNSPLIQNLREQQSTANRKVSELSATYLPNHPKMIAAQKELAAISGSLKREALKVVDSLQGQAKVANQRAEALRANLEKLKGRESGANISDVKLKGLERDAQANRTLLESMLGRYADASARQDVTQQPSKARIIQRAAVPPTPYFPKVGPTIFLITMAGLALGLGLAFIMEVMSASANAVKLQRLSARSHVAANQIERSLDIPAIDIPTKLATEHVVATMVQKTEPDGMRPVANMTTTVSRGEAIELLTGENDASSKVPIATALSAVCQSLKDNKAYKAFSFTSLGSEGPDAAVAALSTARALSMNKKRVAIIDISQTGGDIEMLAGLPGGVGLTDLVAGTADFTKIISRDPHSTLHIIRKGLSRDQDTASRVSGKFESVITALSSIYDFVFVHVGEAYGAAPSLVKSCPAGFILAGALRQRDALAAAQILRTNGVLASMLIQVDVKPTVQNRKVASA